uniref:Translation initiation factor IF-2 N-terminal domain-containing protein n=1 Tax=Desertifilum tharense IPPAS B-1220 TaxID=1781255 RepID=A0ACD5GR70_9CYAN
MKKREEEEEEEELLKTPKVGKAATKAKRRPLVIDDEDEDLDDDLDDENAAAEVSLSLMRSAKPKSASAATKAPAAAPRSAPKRPGTQDNSRAARRDRRDQPKQERPEKISLTGGITVRELANQMAVQETEIVRLLFLKGIAATVTQTLDLPTVNLVAQELGIEVETKARESEARKVTEMLDADDLENLQRRPPVVTIMGHVDHGKTTLLDSIRKTKVAAGEAGGITQHIGAYHVDLDHAGETQQIVFLDTPGHEAFTAMRARGQESPTSPFWWLLPMTACVPKPLKPLATPSTAEVPIVVAINKVDKEGT